MELKSQPYTFATLINCSGSGSIFGITQLMNADYNAYQSNGSIETMYDSRQDVVYNYNPNIRV